MMAPASEANARVPFRPETSGELLLRGSPLDPLVAFDRIPPEVLFGRKLSLDREVLLDDLESDRDRPPLIAVRPVAPVEHAVQAENVHDLVDPGAVEFEVRADFLVGDSGEEAVALRNTSDTFT